jgi:hypothetical protein
MDMALQERKTFVRMLAQRIEEENKAFEALNQKLFSG